MLYRLLGQLLARKNLTVVDSRSFQKPLSVLSVIEKNGIPVKTVFDIGAYKGEWAKELQRKRGDSTKIFLFEPNKEHLDNFSEPNCFVFDFALGATEESRRKFYSLGGTGDSLFREKSHHYKAIRPKEIVVRTLDNVVQEFTLPTPEVIKLDCQGAELEIFQGARKTLLGVKAVIVETSIIETNQGSPRVEKVCDYLINHNFRPVSVSELHNRSGLLSQIDIVFYQNNIKVF